MASSSNQPSKLQNSYFFYGTHPLKVPQTLTHANSTTDLINNSDTTHLSLQLNSHTFQTTKSWNNLIDAQTDHIDDSNEVIRHVSVIFFFLPYLFITRICHCPNDVIIGINVNIVCRCIVICV